MWIYLRNTDGHGCITVGFYDPSGEFQGDSDHTSIESAAGRVHYLNGGESNNLDIIKAEIKKIEGDLSDSVLVNPTEYQSGFIHANVKAIRFLKKLIRIMKKTRIKSHER